MTSGDNIYIYRVTGHMLVYYLTSRMLWLCRVGVPCRRGVELHLVGAEGTGEDEGAQQRAEGLLPHQKMEEE